MFRAAAPRILARSPALSRPARRYISTAPPTQKSRSWKSLVARFGIAGGIIYYYNTTDVFAEEPRHSVQSLPPTESESEAGLPTIESITAEREKRKAVQAKLDEQRQREALSTQRHEPQEGGSEEGGMGGLEEEADQQGAFNPETGEINWDCPCLGGMADGPCGPQFKEAFSCFVFSKEEPKGMDCVDRFKDMQNCFREHPDVYGSELESDAADDEDEQHDLGTAAPAHAEITHSNATPTHSDATPSAAYSDSTPAPPSKPSNASSKPAPKPTSSPSDTESAPADKAKHFSQRSSQPASGADQPGKSSSAWDREPTSESEALVPKGAHDARERGTERLGRK